MNQGVEILLARMDSNPDEFVSWDGYVVGKWDWIMRDVQKRALGNRVDLEDGVVRVPFLSDEEVKALWNKVESLRADQFTKKVMRTLLEEEEPDLMRYSAADMAREFRAKLDTVLLDEWADACKDEEDKLLTYKGTTYLHWEE